MQNPLFYDVKWHPKGPPPARNRGIFEPVLWISLCTPSYLSKGTKRNFNRAESPLSVTCLEMKRKAESEKTIGATVRRLVCCVCLVLLR